MSHPGDSLAPDAAISKACGRHRVLLPALVIVGSGLLAAGVGLVVSGKPRLSGNTEWLRPMAAAGYGVAIGGFLTLLPQLVMVMRLRAGLATRPDGEDPGRTWWPLVLVASALRDTPLLRRTADDFRTAVQGFVPVARGLLAQRLWPACAAAFVAPVLGLVSAWISWSKHLPDAVRVASETVAQQSDTQPVQILEVTPVVDWGLVAWPMIITISLSLALMIAVVIIDQLSGRLLQTWASRVRPLDAESSFVQEQLLRGQGGATVAIAGGRESADKSSLPPSPPPTTALQPPPEPRISAEELEGLGDLFREG
jgi:hypothetical protein